MSNDMAGLSWLQRQQQKLRERKDSMRRAERNPQEVRLMSELQSSRQFRGQQLLQHQQSTTSSTMGGGGGSHRPVDDAGYLSDVTLFSELDMVNTSREGSPDIRSLYATPLHINTAGTYGQYQQVSHAPDFYFFIFSDLPFAQVAQSRDWNLNRFNFDLNQILFDFLSYRPMANVRSFLKKTLIGNDSPHAAKLLSQCDVRASSAIKMKENKKFYLFF
jgi:hypothetical protein